MSKISKYFKEAVARAVNYNQFHSDFLRKLPKEFHPAAKLQFIPFLNTNERAIANKIEAFRPQIPKVSDAQKIASYTSPHSGSFQKDEQGHALSGEYVESNVEAHVKTGSPKLKGMLLRRIVEGYGAKRVLELGTNTGFSGSYFVSVNGVELTTIEGSDALCNIADKNMRRISPKYRIMNNLFDDAIDQLIQENAKFDCVFIDGQHEKEATLHYAERVKPLMEKNAIYIFDDIYWSDDMNEAWKELVYTKDFFKAVDLFAVGVCVQEENSSGKTALYDLGDYLPRPNIFRKNW